MCSSFLSYRLAIEMLFMPSICQLLSVSTVSHDGTPCISSISPSLNIILHKLKKSERAMSQELFAPSIYEQSIHPWIDHSKGSLEPPYSLHVLLSIDYLITHPILQPIAGLLCYSRKLEICLFLFMRYARFTDNILLIFHRSSLKAYIALRLCFIVLCISSNFRVATVSSSLQHPHRPRIQHHYFINTNQHTTKTA